MNWKSRTLLRAKANQTDLKGVKWSKIIIALFTMVTSILMAVLTYQANQILEKQNEYMVNSYKPIFVNESSQENESEALFSFTQVSGFADNLQGAAYDAVYLETGGDNSITIELNIYGGYDSSLQVYSDRPRIVVTEKKDNFSKKDFINDCIIKLRERGVEIPSYSEWRKINISFDDISGNRNTKQYYIQPFSDSDYIAQEAFLNSESRKNIKYSFDYYVNVTTEQDVQELIDSIVYLLHD